MNLKTFHLAIGDHPLQDALETMTNTIRRAVLHSKIPKMRTLPDERAWMLLGVAIGVFIPVRHWLGFDYKLWVILVLSIAVLEVQASRIALRAVSFITPTNGWSIAKIMVLADIASIPKHQFIARLAAGLIAKVMILVGFGLGQVIAIFINYRSLHPNL